MPGIVGNMASTSLSNATLPYVKILADEGVHQAIKQNSGLARGVNTFEGSITYKSVSESLEMNYTELMGIL